MPAYPCDLVLRLSGTVDTHAHSIDSGVSLLACHTSSRSLLFSVPPEVGHKVPDSVLTAPLACKSRFGHVRRRSKTDANVDASCEIYGNADNVCRHNPSAFWTVPMPVGTWICACSILRGRFFNIPVPLGVLLVDDRLPSRSVKGIYEGDLRGSMHLSVYCRSASTRGEAVGNGHRTRTERTGEGMPVFVKSGCRANCMQVPLFLKRTVAIINTVACASIMCIRAIGSFQRCLFRPVHLDSTTHDRRRVTNALQISIETSISICCCCF